MIEQLFGSKTRVKLLQLFYTNPNRAFYVREITRKIDEQINSVRRELSNLLSIGIISSENNNNRLYYEVDQKYLYYKPLLEMFGEHKTSPIVEDSLSNQSEVEDGSLKTENPMVKAIRSMGNVDLAFLTGQFTRDERSGVDLVIIGDVNGTKAARVVTDLEVQEKKSINYVVLTQKEFKYRIQVRDRFINGVLSSKKQIIINDPELSIEL